jgi:muramidase (phage lysozyme)
MAINSVLNSPNIIGNRKGTVEQFQNFITGGNGSLGSSIVNSTSLNKIVPFERGGVRPVTPDFNSIVSTISTKTDTALNTNIKNQDNKVQGVVNNIQNVFQTTLQNFTKGYQDKLKSIEDSKPSKILEKFFGLYNNVTGFIQFFVDKKNLNKTSASLKGLRKLFEDSFEIAKLIRITINKIVNQLSNLPTATPFGGANLTKNATEKVSGGGRGKMLALGAGALGAGMLAGGTINALSGSENLQPAVVQQSIPKDLANSLSSIINRFSNAIDNLIKAAGGTPNSTSKPSGGGSSGGAPKPSPGPEGPGSGPTQLIQGNAPSEIKSLMDVISGPESGGNYESMNTGAGGTHNLPGATKMTIAEVAKKATGAVGKYQEMPDYLVAKAKAAGLDPNKDLYSPENQDKITRTEIVSGLGGDESKVVAQLQKDPLAVAKRLKGVWPSLPGGTQQLLTQQQFLQNYQKNLKTYQGVPSAPILPSPAQVAAAPTQTKAKADAISKPVNPQAKITTIKMPPKVSSVGGQSQGGGGGGGSAPPPPSKAAPSVPFLPAGNVDNFLVLYSKMVYNIVDG